MATWFVFLDSVLRFNFVFFVCVFPVGDTYFRFGICVSVFWKFFSVLGFRFVLRVSVLFVFLVCSLLFLLLLLSCGFFVSISHPIYLIALCI